LAQAPRVRRAVLSDAPFQGRPRTVAVPGTLRRLVSGRHTAGTGDTARPDRPGGGSKRPSRGATSRLLVLRVVHPAPSAASGAHSTACPAGA
jgi:hypothetical protein